MRWLLGIHYVVLEHKELKDGFMLNFLRNEREFLLGGLEGEGQVWKVKDICPLPCFCKKILEDVCLDPAQDNLLSGADHQGILLLGPEDAELQSLLTWCEIKRKLGAAGLLERVWFGAQGLTKSSAKLMSDLTIELYSNSTHRSLLGFDLWLWLLSEKPLRIKAENGKKTLKNWKTNIVYISSYVD